MHVAACFCLVYPFDFEGEQQVKEGLVVMADPLDHGHSKKYNFKKKKTKKYMRHVMHDTYHVTHDT